MKVNIKSSVNLVFPVILCGFFVTSCGPQGSGDDTNPATVVNGIDTALPVSHDSLAADHTRLPPPVDTSNSGIMARPRTDTAGAGTKIDTSLTANPASKH